MSSSEDIENLRQLKESEPLQNAWDNWIQVRQVRVYFHPPFPSLKEPFFFSSSWKKLHLSFMIQI